MTKRPKILTLGQVHDRLEVAIAEAGSQKAFAESVGLSTAYINDLLHGRRGYTDAILAPLGVKREIIFTESVSK